MPPHDPPVPESGGGLRVDVAALLAFASTIDSEVTAVLDAKQAAIEAQFRPDGITSATPAFGRDGTDPAVADVGRDQQQRIEAHLAALATVREGLTVVRDLATILANRYRDLDEESGQITQAALAEVSEQLGRLRQSMENL